jgi:sugar phosphate isomerase/epimerase
MKHVKVGICLESLGLPLRRALQEAEKLGVTGVQVDAVSDLSPNTLSQTGRREFRHLLRAHNLELTAVGCPLRRGLDTAENQQGRIEHLKKVMTLSFDLGPRIVIIQAGHVPERPEDPRTGLLTEALRDLGLHGDRIGVVLSMETGLESGQVLKTFLERFDTAGLGVNFDPANLLMNGFDPYADLRTLRGKVVHVHAKDARVRGANRAAQIVPLGHGDMDWMQMAATLEEIEYRGWLVVEQEVSDNRLADVASGVAFLRRLVG